jgi:hypothetical protein
MCALTLGLDVQVPFTATSKHGMGWEEDEKVECTLRLIKGLVAGCTRAGIFLREDGPSWGTVASTDAGTEYIASTLALSNPSHSWGISGSVGRP